MARHRAASWSEAILQQAHAARAGTHLDEHEVARLVLVRLADRRVLFNPGEWEMPDHCLLSVLEIREGLTDLIEHLSPASVLAIDLRELRDACRAFCDDLRPMPSPDGYPPVRGIDMWRLRDALLPMRETFGRVLGDLANRYDLAPEPQLARLIADSGGTL